MECKIELMLLRLILGVVHVARSTATDVSSASGVTSAPSSVAPPLEEFCQMESFTASCAADEVIQMQESRLGRLKIGRCVKEASEAYPINCTLDVKPEMDQFCSGRRRCEVRIDDHSFRRLSPCPRDLKVHLWASYQCRKVTIPKTSCRQTAASYTINNISGSGWLASQTTEETGCGLTETPWIIQVGPGQRINVTMYDMSYDYLTLRDFGDSSDQGSSSVQHLEQQRHQYPRTCRVFATIREPSRGTTSTVCGTQGRVVNVFTSDGDRIELRIMTATQRPSSASSAAGPQSAAGGAIGASGAAGSAMSRNVQGHPVAGSGNIGSIALQMDPYFLFRYDVLGCADPAVNVADDRTLRRRTSADTMTVSCVGSEVTWTLHCAGNEWIGTNTANCSFDGAATLGQPAYPVALSGIVVIIIAIFVSSVILLIGIICIKWRMKKEFVRRQRLCQSEYDPAAYGLGSEMTSQGGGKSRMMLDGSYAGGGCNSMNGDPLGVSQDAGYSAGAGAGLPGGRNEYARMRLQQQQQQQQQRMCSHYTGGPCGFESGVVGPGSVPYGHRFPSSPSTASRFVEHIYESPDTLRRENNNGPIDEHYTPTVPFDGAAWGPPAAGYPMRLQQQQQHWQQPGCGGAGYYPTPSTPTAAVHHAQHNVQSSVASPSKDGSVKNKSKKNAGNYSL